MNGKLLEDGTTMSDENLAKQVTKVSKLSDKASLSWVSVEVVLQSLVASAISGSVYTGYRMLETGPPTIGTVIHTVTGLVLGVLLVTRITIGLSAVSEAAATVQAFHKACRTLAVLTSYVGETLTISAGAELEKKAVANFRYELVRLLNLAVFSYQLMLHGQKMTLPPATLRAAGGKMEVEVRRHATPTPTACPAQRRLAALRGARVITAARRREGSLPLCAPPCAATLACPGPPWRRAHCRLSDPGVVLQPDRDGRQVDHQPYRAAA
eukprot:1725358-Prymnesium_polylepis.1